MDLQKIAATEFVVLRATWSIEKSRQLIEQLKPSHVIIHRQDQQDAYYLFSTQEFLNLLSHAASALSIHEALHLQERVASPTLESSTNAEDAPDQCIVLEEGYPIGFFDASFPPVMTSRGGRDEGTASVKLDFASQSLITEFPEMVYLDESFSLLVFLSSAFTPQIGANSLDTLPLGAVIDIIVQPRRGFVLEGSGEGHLLISSEDETLPLQFRLRGIALDLGRIRVLAFHKGQPLGALTLSVTVLEASASADMQHRSREQSLTPVSFHQPDLSLFILEHTNAGLPTLTFRLTAQDPTLELNLKLFGPIQLRVDSLHYFQDFFKDIETLSFKNSSEKSIAEQRLATKGLSLFTSLFPTDLQVLLWSLRNHVQSVQVQSEEPWIPWELCKLHGQEDGRVVEGPFLCEAFAFTRWLPGIPLKPSLQLNNMAIVGLSNSSQGFALEERTSLLPASGDNPHVSSVPATFVELRKALASGEYDGWYFHFSGHGGLREVGPYQSIISLENQETLTPEDLSGIVGNLGMARPLVFFNASRVGDDGISLTGVSGWVRQFLHAGAGAFIGTYWSVDDQSAYSFAQALYSRLLHGIPIGRAVQEARAAIKSVGDPTWLAYTTFADPLATVRNIP